MSKTTVIGPIFDHECATVSVGIKVTLVSKSSYDRRGVDGVLAFVD